MLEWYLVYFLAWWAIYGGWVLLYLLSGFVVISITVSISYSDSAEEFYYEPVGLMVFYTLAWPLLAILCILYFIMLVSQRTRHKFFGSGEQC